MINYNKRLVEVNTILNLLPEEHYKKIPKDVIKAIQDNMDKGYTWKYDKTKELKDQDVSRDTIAILSYINIEYLLNENQKEYMNNLHKINEQKQRKAEYSHDNSYDYDKLFKSNNNQQECIEKEQETDLIVKYKENFFIKIINKIKSFLNKL